MKRGELKKNAITKMYKKEQKLLNCRSADFEIFFLRGVCVYVWWSIAQSTIHFSLHKASFRHFSLLFIADLCDSKIQNSDF